MAPALMELFRDYPIASLAIGIILGGIIGGVSLFLGNLLFVQCVKPRLSWDIIRVTQAHLSGVGLDHPPQIPFYSTMIAIRNTGMVAAKNCSGHLEIGGVREHICWFLPSSRRVITINRDDFEFLEVCGWQEPDNFGVRNRKRIAPTENGWQGSGSNRDLDIGGVTPIRGKIVVTASNARSIELPITILPVQSLTSPTNQPLFERRGESEEEVKGRKETAISYLSIGIALFSLALISKGAPQLVVGITSGFFLVSSLILFFARRTLRIVTSKLKALRVGYLSIFLALIAATIAAFQKNLLMIGNILLYGSYCFLIVAILINLVKALSGRRED